MHRHIHVQANIKQTMPARYIRADVAKVFDQDPDTIVFNEAVRVTHDTIRAAARAYGFEVYIPSGSASQVVLAWRADRFERIGPPKSPRVSRGRAKVQPNRHVPNVPLRDKQEPGRVFLLAGTHTIASGWTGAKRVRRLGKWVTDAWRRHQWHGHVRAMGKIVRAGYKAHGEVIWSGDMNRPWRTWKKGQRPFSPLRPRSVATDLLGPHKATHGRSTYDYVGVLSRRKMYASFVTRAMHSDHHLVRAHIAWDHDATGPKPKPTPPKRKPKREPKPFRGPNVRSAHRSLRKAARIARAAGAKVKADVLMGIVADIFRKIRPINRK